MALDDRDYMRRRTAGSDNECRPFSNVLTIAAIVIVLAVSGLWLYRGAHLSGNAEGSLVVNINTATQSEIESLPGIGPALAALVMADRPYARVTELERVRGISKRQVQSLQPLLTVTEVTHRVDDRSIVTRFVEWAAQLSLYYAVIYALLTLLAIYYANHWLRIWWRCRQNVRTRRLAANAERR